MLIARIALIAWIPLSVLLGGFLRAPQAAPAILLGAVMFLPTRIGWDFPGLPAMGRAEIASVCLVGVVVLFHSGRLGRARLGRGIDWLIVASCVGILITTLGNQDRLELEAVTLNGLKPYDALSEAFPDLLYIAVPAIACRALVRSAAELRAFQRLFLGAVLFYTVLVLFELRFSPQLHRWTYGFHPHAFHQHIRYGGYRPMVYLGSGLVVSFFLATATIFAGEFARSRRLILGAPAIAVAGWLWLVLVASKSLAAIIYGTLGGAAVFLLRPRLQMQVAMLISILALSYAPLRIAGVLSTDRFLAVASTISEERAESLEFRFRNEDALIERGNERPFFGWGGFQRSMIFDSWGDMKSIVDGHWIIAYGRRGFVGMALGFAILFAPVLIAYRRFGRLQHTDDQRLVAATSLTLAFTLVDLQPNAMFTYLPYMLGGALIGSVEGMAVRGAQRKSVNRTGTQRKARASERPALPDRAAAALAAGPDAPGKGPAGGGASLGAARRDSRR